ncbi:hypothetical protein VULLAG_LOCUS23471 [Vulpes lagopus]
MKPENTQAHLTILAPALCCAGPGARCAGGRRVWQRLLGAIGWELSLGRFHHSIQVLTALPTERSLLGSCSSLAPGAHLVEISIRLGGMTALLAPA